MTSPQKENGYTAIANEIIDVLVSYRIPGEQMQCLWFILRKTYGYNKKLDNISLSQFEKATGLKKTSVVRALNGLLKKNIINKKVNGYVATYWFNKKYTEWDALTKKLTYKPKSSLLPWCYLCGYDKVINRHHIVHQSVGGSDRVENIIILCPNCHALVHKGDLDEKQLINKKVNAERTGKKPLTKKIHTKDNITKENNIPPISPKKPKPAKKKSPPFLPPPVDDVIQFFVENGFPESLARKVHAYYQDNDWKDSRNNPVKNWKQKMRGVWFKDENKTKNDKHNGFKEKEYVGTPENEISWLQD